MAEMGAVPLVLDRKARARAAIAGSAGNLIEWYDFYAYAYTALYFASAFFPSGARTAQLLNVAAIYAAGFLLRPLAGSSFRRYADRHVRRAALVRSEERRVGRVCVSTSRSRWSTYH